MQQQGGEKCRERERESRSWGTGPERQGKLAGREGQAWPSHYKVGVGLEAQETYTYTYSPILYYRLGVGW